MKVFHDSDMSESEEEFCVSSAFPPRPKAEHWKEV